MRSRPSSTAIDDEAPGRSLVPRRPRRLRAAPEPLLHAGRRRADVCLVGNHDLGVLGRSSTSTILQPDAAASARWTARPRRRTHRVTSRRSSPSAQVAGLGLYHASPRDPVWEYVLSPDVRPASLEATEAPLVLVGHSHVPLAISLDGRPRGRAVSPRAGTEVDLANGAGC